MSQFDLKQAHVFARDGYSASGVVNHLSGYDPGATVLAVDGFTGIVANGNIINIAGDLTNYTVVSHTEVLGATVSITISPGLVAAAADNAVVTEYEPNAVPAAVDNVAGYAIGATTLLIKNFVGLVANGAKVKITGQPTVYTVTASTPTLGNTTSITVTPGLTAAVINNQVLTFYEDTTIPGAISNSAAGYPTPTNTMGISGITGALMVGDVFYIAGDPEMTKYVISDTVETLGNTTSVTFEPATSTGFSVPNGATITVGPHEIDIKLGDGNLTYSEKKNREYKLDRGKISEVRNGDEAPVEIKLDAVWEWIKASTGEIPTIEDVLKKRGVAADWVSTDEDQCRPYCVDLIIEYRPECEDGTEIETIYLSDFRYEQIDHDAKAGTFSITGKCNITEATSVRSAA